MEGDEEPMQKAYPLAYHFIFTLHVGYANFLKIDLDIDLEETLDNILENN